MKLWIIKIMILIAGLPIVFMFFKGSSCDFYYHGRNQTTGVEGSFSCERGKAIFSAVNADSATIYHVEGRYFSFFPDYFYIYR